MDGGGGCCECVNGAMEETMGMGVVFCGVAILF